MKYRTWSVSLAIALVGSWACISLAQTEEPTDLPTVTGKGNLVGGEEIRCFTTMCGDAEREEPIALLELFLKDVTQMPQGYLELDKTKFCQNLKSKKPSGCSASNPPSVPGFDPSWEPNGCGTGGLANWIADRILSSAYTDSYSGEINAPFVGVSFLAACNAHDRC